MSGLGGFDDVVWDRFFEFVYPCDPKQPREEVQAELRRLGIDVKPAVNAVLQAVESARAKMQLAAARQRRAGMEAMAGHGIPAIPPPPEGLRTTLRELIAQRFGSTEAAAHWYKLEKQASDNDLRSLLADLHVLETLPEAPPDGESPAE